MNVEKAYEIIATCAQFTAGDFGWDSLLVEVRIFDQMAQVAHWVVRDEKKLQGNGSLPFELSIEQLDSILYLRDNLVETTGQRPWGLLFTLWPNGKFNIKYDYNKPDEYEAN